MFGLILCFWGGKGWRERTWVTSIEGRIHSRKDRSVVSKVATERITLVSKGF